MIKFPEDFDFKHNVETISSHPFYTHSKTKTQTTQIIFMHKHCMELSIPYTLLQHIKACLLERGSLGFQDFYTTQIVFPSEHCQFNFLKNFKYTAFLEEPNMFETCKSLMWNYCKYFTYLFFKKISEKNLFPLNIYVYNVWLLLKRRWEEAESACHSPPPHHTHNRALSEPSSPS